MDFEQNFYKATRNANSSWPVFPHCCWTLSCWLVTSAVQCWLVTRVTLYQLLLSVALSNSLAFPYLLPVSSRSRAQAFLWFRAKTDKGIIRLVDHLHNVTHSLSDATSGQLWAGEQDGACVLSLKIWRVECNMLKWEWGNKFLCMLHILTWRICNTVITEILLKNTKISHFKVCFLRVAPYFLLVVCVCLFIYHLYYYISSILV